MIYEFYYSKLNSLEQRIYRNLQKALEAMQEEMLISGFFDIDRIDMIFEAIHWDHPELFHVNFHSYRRGVSKEGVIFVASYFYTMEEYKKKQRQIEKVIEKLMEMANKENLGTDLKKCIWIHDRLVRNIVYGGKHIPNTSEVSEAHTIVGVFLQKLAVCEGISMAFKLLSDRLGLKSIVAYGEAGMGDGGPHAWNISCIDGEFVQVDATWDGNLSLACQYFRYDYFAMTDLEIQLDHEYTTFLDYPICGTMKYSYFSRKNCLLSNPKQLEAFFEKEFKAKSDTIYFKIKGNIANKEKFSQKVLEMLIDFMQKYGIIEKGFLDWSNHEALIFMFKRQ